jgi:mono/diheme cytochrome c family protein
MQVLLHGSQLKTDQFEALMPAFGAYRDQELAAVANYVLDHFGGKQAQITPETIARARNSSD